MAQDRQSLGPANWVKIPEPGNSGKEWYLPLITTGTRDRPAGTTTERAYVNEKQNPPKSRTVPGGPGSYSFTRDRSAQAANIALERWDASQDAGEFVVGSNEVVEVTIPTGAKITVLTAAGAATFTGIDLTQPKYAAGQFIVIGAIAYILERIITGTTATLVRVGSVVSDEVTADENYTAATPVNAATDFKVIIPCEVEAFNATVTVGSSSFSPEATEDTVTFNLTDPPSKKYWVATSLNPEF